MANKNNRTSASQDRPDQNEKHEAEARKSFWTTLPGFLTGLAAVITAIGTLITVLISSGLIGARSNETPSPSATIPAPAVTVTETAESPTHTSTWTITPEPGETYTPSPTSTNTLIPSATPTFSPGADFQAGCIHSSIWQPYQLRPERDSLGCWDLSPWGFFAQDGGLLLQHQETKDNNKVGFYKKLATDAEIELNVRIDQITTRDDLDAILIFAIIPDNPADPDRGRFLYFFVGGGSMNIAQRQPGAAYKIWRTNQPFRKEYKVYLSLRARELSMFVDGEPVFNPVILPYNERAFWIGYNLWSESTIDAFISDLNIEEN